MSQLGSLFYGSLNGFLAFFLILFKYCDAQNPAKWKFPLVLVYADVFYTKSLPLDRLEYGYILEFILSTILVPSLVK